MRILGYIDHPYLKITVFKTDTRLSVKFEDSQNEQTYKFRQADGLASFEDVRRFVDGPFLQGVMQEFRHMNDLRQQALHRHLPPKGNEFEEII